MSTFQIVLGIIGFLLWTSTVWLLGYFIGWVAAQNKQGTCPFANLPPAKEKEPRGIEVPAFAGKEKLIVALIIATASLASCFPKQDPLIFEKPIPCAIPELRERESLPGIQWLPQEEIGENRCLSEDEYLKLKQLVAILRSHEQYLEEMYQSAKERCSE